MSDATYFASDDAAQMREEATRILRRRAVELAREDRQEDVGAQIEIVEFLLAHERYGIESRYVREVYPLKELTPVPGTPPFILGIINLRGQIISVNDLKKFFDLPERGITDLNKVIILEDGNMEFGILADVVSGTRMVPLAQVQSPPASFTGIRQEYLRGIAEGPIAILDGARLLGDLELVVDEEIESTTGGRS